MAAAKTLQAQARTLEILTTVATVIICVGLVVRYALPVILATVPQAGDPSIWSVVGQAAIDAFPSIVLIGALDASRKLFRALARGEVFSDAVGAGVKGIGTSLLGAALAVAVIQPWLQSWVDGDYGFGGIRLDTMTWVLGVVGAALLMLGRLLQRAKGLQAELEQFV